MNVAQVPWYYRSVIAVATPLYRLFVYKKSGKLPTYRREVDERFGHKYLPVPVGQKGLIWCHAVSLGEINTAYPLLKLLLNHGFALWITSTTQTGFSRVSVLFEQELGDTVNHSFVPVDSTLIVRQFLAHIRPMMALFIETELWATTLFELKRQRILSVMVNARLTQQSFLGYQKFATLSQSMMKNLSLILAQDKQSASYFAQLGADNAKICVVDSLKWASAQQSSPYNEQLLATINTEQWQLHRPIWVAASTHEGEEVLILDAHRQILQTYPDAVLILVPRHPERFDDVARLCVSYITHRRSHQQRIAADTQVYLADTMGELPAWYTLAQVVFVGGSLVDVGGHNPIEPAMLAKPIIMGSYVKNCELLVQGLSAVQALVQNNDVSSLSKQVLDWFDAPQRAIAQGEQGRQLVYQKRHAAKRQCQHILTLIAHTC